jgi:prolyl-tRNA editing enzyme YbaK/EbsC (Cys-tRNA(Pro) deacylase)
MKNNSLEHLEAFLKEKQVDYTLFTDSRPIRSAKEGADLYGILLSEATPTLILKIEDQYYAAIICGDKRISFEKLKYLFDVEHVSLASPHTVLTLTGAKIGEVGVINKGMPTLIDTHVVNNKYCYCGTGISGKTLRINTADLLKVTHAKVLDFCL